MKRQAGQLVGLKTRRFWNPLPPQATMTKKMKVTKDRFAKSVRPLSFAETYQEGLRLFMGQGELNQTLARLVRNLEEHHIEYMVVGDIALIAHGYRRFTEDIDLVMTSEALDTFHRELIGLGYAPQFPGARKRIRSTVDGVSIDVIVSGEYPGDGNPKPVTIPRPEEASTEIEGVRVVTLAKLIEIKLASGMTAPHRLRDLADVQELIKARGLGAEFAEQIDPYVRSKYLELWNAVASSGDDDERDQYDNPVCT